jgi:hypothetical protein
MRLGSSSIRPGRALIDACQGHRITAIVDLSLGGMSTSTQIRVLAFVLAATALGAAACADTRSPFAEAYAGAMITSEWSDPPRKSERKQSTAITVDVQGDVRVGILTTTLDTAGSRLGLHPTPYARTKDASPSTPTDARRGQEPTPCGQSAGPIGVQRGSSASLSVPPLAAGHSGRKGEAPGRSPNQGRGRISCASRGRHPAGVAIVIVSYSASGDQPP